MVKNRRERILSAFKGLMSGIIRLALRNGVGYKEFTQLCKSLYVGIASREYGLRGRATNISRIAIMTGLDRKDVRKELEIREDLQENVNAPDKISRIISAWRSQSPFCDKDKNPLPLPLVGQSPSFSDLTKEYGGDLRTSTIVKELKRSKTIIENEQGLLELQKYYFIPNYLGDPDKEPDFVDPDTISHGSSMLVDHINTIFHNLYRDDESSRRRLELRATSSTVDRKKVAEFYRLVDEKAMEFLYQIDDWLQANENKQADADTERLGIGVYFIQGSNQNKTQIQARTKKGLHDE